jgi:hypothetical protein
MPQTADGSPVWCTAASEVISTFRVDEPEMLGIVALGAVRSGIGFTRGK